MDKDRYFSEYEAFTENEILEVAAQGIELKNGMYINFADFIFLFFYYFCVL